jgi:hypothetical protein
VRRARTQILVAEEDLPDGFAERHLGRPIPEELFELFAKAARRTAAHALVRSGKLPRDFTEADLEAYLANPPDDTLG